MSNMRMKHKLIMSMMAGAIMIPGSVVRIQAAENEEQQSVVPTAGIESALEECYRTKVKENKEQHQSVSGADRRGRVFEYSVF